MINWKQAAKYYRSQFLLWVQAYNELADVYKIAESRSVGNGVTFTYRLNDTYEVVDISTDTPEDDA